MVPLAVVSLLERLSKYPQEEGSFATLQVMGGTVHPHMYKLKVSSIVYVGYITYYKSHFSDMFLDRIINSYCEPNIMFSVFKKYDVIMLLHWANFYSLSYPRLF